MAAGYFTTQLPSVDRYIELADYACNRAKEHRSWTKNAAFNLHQATETAYACYLLTRTLYFPRSHNVKFLRSLAEDLESRLIAAWPRDAREDRRRFELVKRAYVEARYSDSYSIDLDDLRWIIDAVRMLREIVSEVGTERLHELRDLANL
jgi:hypothetical protein